MIAMSMLGADNEYCHDSRVLVYPAPAHPVRHAMLHVLSMLGLGIGGVAAMDGDETLRTG
jgi:hypothetical protein